MLLKFIYPIRSAIWRSLDFIFKSFCKIGIHQDYKYDGEWVGQCSLCDYGHPKPKPARKKRRKSK